MQENSSSSRISPILLQYPIRLRKFFLGDRGPPGDAIFGVTAKGQGLRNFRKNHFHNSSVFIFQEPAKNIVKQKNTQSERIFNNFT